MEAKEMFLSMEMEGADQKSGQTGGMVITTNIWMAPKASGYDEIRDFHRRMAEKLNWTPGASEETKMTGQGQPGPQPDGQPQTQPQEQPPAQPAPSAGSAIGGALAGRFGVGRKKQDASSQSASASGSSSLLEMTTEMSNFSSAPVDAARFEVPAGFKQKRAICGGGGRTRTTAISLSSRAASPAAG